MQAIDMGDDLNKYILDADRKIPEAHLHSICCLKQGVMTCRYICLTPNGYICVKKTPIKKTLDNQVLTMSAKGDNCEGIGHYKK